jgi:hypothetical protein
MLSRSQKNYLYTSAAALCYLLIVCNVLMHTHEIVRLSLIHFSIGFLPFGSVPLLLGLSLHCSQGFGGQIREWQGINGIIWLGGAVISAVKVVELDKEEIDGRTGSRYPVSDKVIDVAVMGGVYAVLGCLESS